jgi:hypothetical protein
MNSCDLRAFQGGYLECAAWASADTDEDGEVLNLDEFAYSRACEDALKLQALQFFHAHYDLLAEAAKVQPWDHLGQDLWLTRNSHGTGFWDRGLPLTLGDDLTKAAHNAGPVDLYLNDDQEIDIA